MTMPQHGHAKNQTDETLAGERMEQITRRLADEGHRITPQRLCILRALLETGTHPSAEEIFEHVRRVSPTTSLATVYKTLETLKEMGEVMEVDAQDDCHHYDGLRPASHPHAICSHCGKIVDVDMQGLETLNAQAAHASGFLIERQHVSFYGLCGACR